jgi:hypothetical protein
LTDVARAVAALDLEVAFAAAPRPTRAGALRGAGGRGASLRSDPQTAEMLEAIAPEPLDG